MKLSPPCQEIRESKISLYTYLGNRWRKQFIQKPFFLIRGITHKNFKDVREDFGRGRYRGKDYSICSVPVTVKL